MLRRPPSPPRAARRPAARLRPLGVLLLTACGFLGCDFLKEASECLPLANPNAGPHDPALEKRCAELVDFLPEAENSLGGRTEVAHVAEDDGRLVLNLVLTDSLGQPLADVPAEAITAFGRRPGGEEEPITLLGQGTLGEPVETLTAPRLSFAAVLDHSGSVPDTAITSMSRNLVRLYEALAQPFESAVIQFSTEVETVQAYTRDAERLATAAAAEEIERSLTSLFDGLMVGIQLTQARSPSLYRFILLVTDGGDNDSRASLSEVIAAAKTARLPIYIVGVGFADLDVIRRLARETGGYYIYVPRFNGLSEAYGALSRLVVGSRQVVLDAAPGVYEAVRLEIDAPGGRRSVAVDL